jgi:hypothetical protein
MPPFRHGEESHSSIGVSHASPVQPESKVTYVGDCKQWKRFMSWRLLKSLIQYLPDRNRWMSLLGLQYRFLRSYIGTRLWCCRLLHQSHRTNLITKWNYRENIRLASGICMQLVTIASPPNRERRLMRSPCCLCVTPPIITKQLHKHVPMATNTHATIEELLNTVFSVQPRTSCYKVASEADLEFA